jgi:hypothetical protein
MSFNYNKEKQLFDDKWYRLLMAYRKFGMPEDAIHTMYEFDLDWFNQRRNYVNHTQPYPDEMIVNEDRQSRSTLAQKFPSLCTSFDSDKLSDRYGWLETIENPVLAEKLKRLSMEDIELLTFLIIEGHSQVELAQAKGCAQQAISKRFIRIKKILRKRL